MSRAGIGIFLGYYYLHSESYRYLPRDVCVTDSIRSGTVGTPGVVLLGSERAVVDAATGLDVANKSESIH